MQMNIFPRTGAALLAAAVVLGGCSSADGPYASIENPPLLEARLHTVTLQVADPAVIDRRLQPGYRRLPPAPNYPGSVRVEAALWKVPEDVAAAPVLVVPGDGKGMNYRYLVMPPAAPAPDADPDLVNAFYERVLGDAAFTLADGDSAAAQRVHSLSYLVDDVVAAKKKLQQAGIPITFSPVAITTSHFGDHKLVGITAPDGVIIELVETAAH